MNEFSRPIAVTQVGDKESRHAATAEPAEREALAARLGLLGLDYLEGDVAVKRIRGGTVLRVTGHLSARATQECVATLEPLTTEVDEDFAENFALAEPGKDHAEVLIDPESEEEVEPLSPELLDGGAFDLGELLVQLLAERLDPYPRHPDAGPEGGEWGPTDVEQEETRKPFAELARKLKRH